MKCQVFINGKQIVEVPVKAHEAMFVARSLQKEYQIILLNKCEVDAYVTIQCGSKMNSRFFELEPAWYDAQYFNEEEESAKFEAKILTFIKPDEI